MQRNPWGPVLTFGLGTAVAMWALGYLARMPPAPLPSPALFVAILVLACLGGALAGRHGGLGVAAGAGLVTGAVNLLVLGGALTSGLSAYWAPASLLFTAALAGLGGLLGRRRPAAPLPARRWAGRLARVLFGATVVLVASGGLVTGLEAGLAVPDWPNTFGYFLFAYPLARMTGGVYYEHAHRLYGSLVGLTTMTVGLYLWRVEDRRGVRRLALGLFLFVVVQGVLGGLRVTGRPTLARDPARLRPSTALAVVHGVTAQVFLALVTVLVAVTSPTWRAAPAPAAPPRGERALPRLLVALLLVQLVLGAVQRHVGALLHVHLALAVLVGGAAAAAGARAWTHTPPHPILRRLGRALVYGVALQILLGVAAALTTGAFGGPAASGTIQVPVTTAHQVTGALLLAAAVALLVWSGRLAAGADAP